MRIAGVHHDDFPNVYYTIQMMKPIHMTTAAAAAKSEGKESLEFDHEKQTDANHIVLPPQKKKNNNNANSNKRDSKGPDVSAEEAAAIRDLQQSLSAMGSPINIKIGYSNIDYAATIGTECTVGQLKLLASALTDVPVPDMKLICKGQVLRLNNEYIKDTRVREGSKLVLMSGKVHVV